MVFNGFNEQQLAYNSITFKKLWLILWTGWIEPKKLKLKHSCIKDGLQYNELKYVGWKTDLVVYCISRKVVTVTQERE
jgi:hypothetical protein